MLFASRKTANSSAGWALAPPPGRRGSLIPADTEVTGQAPNRPSELGEVAFAVTRSRPRHRRDAAQGDCPGWGPGTPRRWARGGPWVPGRLLGRVKPAGTREKQTHVYLFLEARQRGGKRFLCTHMPSFPCPFLARTWPSFAKTFNLLARNFLPQETV